MDNFIAEVCLTKRQLSPPPSSLISHIDKAWSSVKSFRARTSWIISTTENAHIDFGKNSNDILWVGGVAQLTNRCGLDRILTRNGIEPCISDIQRIAKGFELFSSSWFLELRGLFSVVLLRRSGDVVIVRDQMGLCPFYYFLKKDTVLFSSDLRALTETGGFSQTLDPVGLAHSVSGEWGDSSRTTWLEIARLPSGHFLTFAEDRQRLTDYWAPETRLTINRDISFRDGVQHVHDLLQQSVDRYLNTGRASLELSGGMDSSSIAGFIANSSKTRQQPVALSWDINDSRSDDPRFANAVVAMHNFEHHRVPAGASRQSAIDRVIRWRDTPGAFLLDEIERAQAIAKASGATSYFTGYIGDAVFGGLEWAAFMEFVLGFDLYRTLKHAFWGRRLAKYSLQVLKMHPTYIQWNNRLRPQQYDGIIDTELWLAANLDDQDLDINPFNRDASLEARAKLVRLPLHSRNFETMYRIGCESNLATHHPLADVDLVEYILMLPASFFVGPPMNRTLESRAAIKFLPKIVQDRRSKGDGTWSAINGILALNPKMLIKHQFWLTTVGSTGIARMLV